MAFFEGFETTNTAAFSMQRSSAPAAQGSECKDLALISVMGAMLSDCEFKPMAEHHMTDPHYPFIEIAIESNVFEMAGWIPGSMTRIRRDSLCPQLTPILAMERAQVS